jgi:hypothetical protein
VFGRRLLQHSVRRLRAAEAKCLPDKPVSRGEELRREVVDALAVLQLLRVSLFEAASHDGVGIDQDISAEARILEPSNDKLTPAGQSPTISGSARISWRVTEPLDFAADRLPVMSRDLVDRCLQTSLTF